MRAYGQRRIILLTLFLMLTLFTVSGVFAQEATHVVRPGENLYRIAEEYGISVSALAEANDIAYTWRIYSGQTLVIPGAAPVSVASSNLPAGAANANVVYHTVSYGESLGAIARRYNLSPDQLAALNDITNPNLIYAGQELVVSAGLTASASNTPADSAAPNEPALSPVIPGFSVVMPPPNQAQPEGNSGSTGASHTVSSGESLSGIANRYGVSMLAITQANNIYDVNTIFIGQELIIPAASVTSSPVDMGISTVAAAPPPRLTIGREIIVDLSEQRVYAYENGVLIRNVLVSTGLPATPTVQGDFTVQRKYAAQTMSGPDYYLPDVPYILYFYAGYALHGTYWHSNWGQPMSHGCVNLPTPEAEWFYNWADVGTRVHVQV